MIKERKIIKIKSSKNEKKLPIDFSSSLLSSSSISDGIQTDLKTKKVKSSDEKEGKKSKTHRTRRSYKFRRASRKLAYPPAAPHNTTLMLMDAYNKFENNDLSDESQNESDFNFSGSFLPNFTKEDYEEYFCGSSFDL